MKNYFQLMRLTLRLWDYGYERKNSFFTAPTTWTMAWVFSYGRHRMRNRQSNPTLIMIQFEIYWMQFIETRNSYQIHARLHMLNKYKNMYRTYHEYFYREQLTFQLTSSFLHLNKVNAQGRLTGPTTKTQRNHTQEIRSCSWTSHITHTHTHTCSTYNIIYQWYIIYNVYYTFC